jgi:hypothetical protein
MQHLIFGGFVLAAAYTFARVEIEIEGPHGWAASLPTWRISNRWTKLFYGNRPLTGYHLWLQLFVLVMAHTPFGLSFCPWSRSAELRIIGFVIVFFLVEDFLWFVLNPAFGIRRFRREHIWWHEPTWWWIMPRDYWVFFAVGCGAYLVGVWLK